MTNKIEDLREHLFDTLKMLKDDDPKMNIDKAKAISDIASKIIDSAKVEVSFIEAAGGKGTGFIPDSSRAPLLPKQLRD